jgi:hypothetical protein
MNPTAVRMRSSRGYGSALNKTPFTTLKIAVFVAIPTDNMTTTTNWLRR